MACIVCKKERAYFLRLPLELMSEGAERYWRANHFTNHEFDHVCRWCAFRDLWSRLIVNTGGMVLDLSMRGALISIAVLLAFASCVRFAASGRVLDGIPIAFGLFLGGMLGMRFLRWVLFAGAGLALAYGVVVAGAYSDLISPLPDVKAMVQREQIKTYGKAQWGETDSQGKSEKTTDGWDPIQASIDRAQAARERRVDVFVKALLRLSPIALELKPDQYRHAARLAGITLVAYYALVFVLGVVLPQKAVGPEKASRVRRAGKGRS